MRVIRFGSDFSGVGAANQALKRLGVDYNEVFACDIDTYARKTFIHNYGEPSYYPEDVYEREIPHETLDLYVTSPPCQSFSLAGQRKGEDDDRGVLFYNSHEFIKKNKPRFFVFENVKGLLSIENGQVFARWLDLLGGNSVNRAVTMFPHEDSVPYNIYWQVLNARNYGVPQNRERVFIVGVRDDENIDFSFPKPIKLRKKLKDILEKNVDEKYYLSQGMLEFFQRHSAKHSEKGNGFSFDPLSEQDNYSSAITARYYKSGTSDPYMKIKSKAISSVNQNVVIAGVMGGGKWDRTHEQSRRVYSPDGVGATIHTMSGGNQEPKIYDDHRIRKLTPRECFRLMDFPDTFDFSLMSDTQAYKQAGNSVVVKMYELIFKELLKSNN